MFQARFNISLSIKPPLSQTVESPKGTNISTPSTSSTYLQSEYMEQRQNVTRKLLPFEDNVGLSEEEDIILAQCIRSGMPKVNYLYACYTATSIEIMNIIGKQNKKQTQNY